ncbi:MAG TPA: hypothetical protein VF809_03595 [Candidatus Saccharimonadales bacterium]
MIAFDHAITGAVVAFLIKRPKAAIPLAFLSHFCLDAIPHFGNIGAFSFNNPTLLSVVAVDALLTICAIVFVILRAGEYAKIVIVCMFAAMLPDIISIPYMLGIYTQNLLYAFHSSIQWFEHPIGAVSEAAYALIVGNLAYRLVGRFPVSITTEPC